MKSLSVGDETGDLAEPRCISARVKNRNPTVPCWLSFVSAALVTELVASEPLPLQFSVPPPPIFLLLFLFFSVRLSFTLVSYSFPLRLFHCPITLYFSFYLFDFSLHGLLLLMLSTLCFCPFTLFNLSLLSHQFHHMYLS